ncbi:MAG: hypothetical protein AB2535_16760 [Candidatus Thiodiazotropha endolucinida]
MDDSTPFWQYLLMYMFLAWLAGQVLISDNSRKSKGWRYSLMNIGCALALIHPPLISWLIGKDIYLSGIIMLFTGGATLVASVYAAVGSPISRPSTQRSIPSFINIAILLSIPLLVSIALELLTLFSVIAYYKNSWSTDADTDINLSALLPTAIAAIFIGQYHIGPAFMEAWKNAVKNQFTTVILRKFNDRESAKWVHKLLEIFGSIGHANLLTDRSFEEEGGTGDGYIDRYFSDHETAGRSSDADWEDKVIELMSESDIASFILLGTPTESLELELELATKTLGEKRVLILLTEHIDGTISDNLYNKGFNIIRINPYLSFFGIRFRMRLTVALNNMRDNLSIAD